MVYFSIMEVFPTPVSPKNTILYFSAFLFDFDVKLIKFIILSTHHYFFLFLNLPNLSPIFFLGFRFVSSEIPSVMMLVLSEFDLISFFSSASIFSSSSLPFLTFFSEISSSFFSIFLWVSYFDFFFSFSCSFFFASSFFSSF